jgi:hypothetical protein
MQAEGSAKIMPCWEEESPIRQVLQQDDRCSYEFYHHDNCVRPRFPLLVRFPFAGHRTCGCTFPQPLSLCILEHIRDPLNPEIAQETRTCKVTEPLGHAAGEGTVVAPVP